MAFKFVTILALISVAYGGVVPVPQVYHQLTAPTATTIVKQTPVAYAAAPTYAAPVAYAQAPVAYAHAPTVVKSVAYAPQHHHAVLSAAKHEEEYDAHPQYKYSYNVQDDLTGDSKSQTEERDGDLVHGEYSLIDSDGFKRIVQYTSDPEHGFNAVVNRIPLEQVKTVVKAVAPVATYAHAAPVPTATLVKEYPAHLAYHH